MTMENYKYYAFVSYRSSDEKWAKWLQDKIEAYRLPTTIQKMNTALPKSKLRPCFRYHTDIQPNELKTELRNKLEQSKYLLVICTPRSAQSPWVGNEIDTFVELGRRDRIIPVIVEGRPYSGNPDTECFNPSLIKHFPHSENIAEDREILGVNIHEEGRGSTWMKRERAVIQIVSRMLDVNYDQLWNRQRRRIISRAIFGTLLGLLFVCAIAMTWIFNQPFDSQITLTEQSVQNANLPALRDAFVTLTIANETKRDTLASLDDKAIFNNLPAKTLGKEAHLTIAASDWLTTDTTIILSESLSLPIQRNPQTYGHLTAYVFKDGKTWANKQLRIGKYTVTTNGDGYFEVDIPLSEQSVEYEVTDIQTGAATLLYAPCGPSDAIEL